MKHFKAQHAALFLVLLWGVSVPFLAQRFGMSALVIVSGGVGLFVGAIFLPRSKRRMRSSPSMGNEDAPIAMPPISLVVALSVLALAALATALALAR